MTSIFLRGLLAVIALFSAAYLFILSANYNALEKSASAIDTKFEQVFAFSEAPSRTELVPDINPEDPPPTGLDSDALYPLEEAKRRLLKLRLGDNEPTHEQIMVIYRLITRVYQLQPSHYQALPTELVANQLFTYSPDVSISSLLEHLHLGINERETQIFAGMFIIYHWAELPGSLREQSLPVIRSGLRQQPTRRLLLSAMAESGNVSPFMSLSPNKATSENMKSLLPAEEKSDE